MTTTRSARSRRIAAAVLALPLSLAMTGSALASGGSTVQLQGSESSARTGADGAAPAAEKPASAHVAAAADRPAAAPAAGPRADAGAPGAAAGAASGASAAQATQEAKAAAPQPVAPKPPAQRSAESAAAPAAPSAEKVAVKPADKPAPAAKPADKSAHKPGPARDASSGAAKGGTATAEPQPLSKADKNGTGANPGAGDCTHSYCSTRDGSPSGNGNGAGEAKGKPCAGCVGKADNKNPKGQGPDGSDRNAGYECDRNAGIGRTNPAHSGCASGATTPATPNKPETPNKPQTPRKPDAPKKPGDVGGPFPEVELCPDGSVMPQDGPAGCPTAPPVCPADSLLGPIMAGCPSEVPPTQGGGSPIEGGTEQPAEGSPIGGVTPAQPVTNPVQVGPPSSVPSRAVPIAIVPNTGVDPTPLAGGTRLPGTGAVPSALPFTGTDAALLAALGLVLLLGGGGILVVARQERIARAA